MRLDLFMKAQPFKEYLATKVHCFARLTSFCDKLLCSKDVCQYSSDRTGSLIKTNRLHLHEQQAQF